MLALLAAILVISAASVAHAAEAIRFFVPSGAHSLPFEKELRSIVAEYNQIHPDFAVEVFSKGTDHSALKETVVAAAAGSPPDLALIEAAESESSEAKKIARSFLKFSRTLPVLVVDQERLFRHHLDPEKIPGQWAEIELLAIKLSQKLRESSSVRPESTDEYALALPLQGVRGLWLLEHLTGTALIHRDSSGLKANRDAIQTIVSCRRMLDTPKVARSNLDWDTALRDFVQRRSPLLITTSDMLPYLNGQAAFRWKAVPLRSMSKKSKGFSGGSDLIFLKSDLKQAKNARRFADYLMTPAVSARWQSAGGFLAAQKNKMPRKEAFATASPVIESLIRLEPYPTHPGDADLLRARVEWQQALSSLFGDPGQRQPPENVLSSLDRRLNLPH